MILCFCFFTDSIDIETKVLVVNIETEEIESKIKTVLGGAMA